MLKRMLIDASHPEETRVVVLDGQKVEEFDFEAASKRPLKGNIYLAKVTRVEPSLQAAFVEYGGNRQGFLAFSEIHPDYYQIPVADRQALIAEQMAEAKRRGEDEFESIEMAKPGQAPSASADDAEEDGHQADTSEHSGSESGGDDDEGRFSAQIDGEAEDGENGDGESAGAGGQSEAGGSDSESGERTQAQQAQRPSQRWVRKRHYKIQEVIKRRQIMLIQVVKEERGNKGAALTTYMSLAGRYCVLMPNTPRGGGISRKITNAADRKRLKTAAASLELPDGMGLIIRTAGANRTKIEIKRDYEYLLRMWDSIRELTLRSNAPACVYEEGDLVKRAIRDLYNKDVTDVTVEGDEGYRNAKDFMRMLMPSHAKNVKPYKETVPLFHRHHIEAQLDAMFSNTVTLKSGGYIVINQTEALVAVDVNSGRATREHNIEDTAYKTNLEAAEEIARQLRLRDLAGLIVIDFIDMEDGRNDRNVEKRLRDCVKNDRARIQIGKISQFGLLEMSRQRLRAGVIAGSTVPCPHCAGQGIVRSVESTALRVLRGLEDEGQKQRAAAVTIRVPSDVAVYTLNQKRRELTRIETDYDMQIVFVPDERVTPGNFEIERTIQRSPEERNERAAKFAITPDLLPPPEEAEPDYEEPEEGEEIAAQQGEPDGQRAAEGERPAEGEGRRRRRRGRGRDRDRSEQPAVMREPVPSEGDTEFDAEQAVDAPQTHSEPLPQAAIGEDGEARRKRRRRRRGRRGRRDQTGEMNPDAVLAQDGSLIEAEGTDSDEDDDDGEDDHAGPEATLSVTLAVTVESPAPMAVIAPSPAADPIPASAMQHVMPLTVPPVSQPVLAAVTPNAASTPQWSLTEPAPLKAQPPAPASLAGPATGNVAGSASPNGHGKKNDEGEPVKTVETAVTEAAPAAPASPPRKGWWQRNLLGRD